jgi:glycosyltransferase involved in cell wall biosynthesis
LLNGVSSLREKGKSGHAPSVLVLVAALNEEEGTRLTLAELRRYLPDSVFLVVDGNSTDETARVAKSQGARVVFQKGKGKGDAILWGLHSVDSDFDYVVFIDADYTYPAEYIPQMISILEANPKVGMVCGNRFNSRTHIGAMRDLFYFGNRLLSTVHNFLNGVNLRDPLTGLRVIRWSVIKNWRPKSEGFDVEVELNHFVENQGSEIVEIDVPYRQRVGVKKLKVKHGFVILNRMLIELSDSLRRNNESDSK